MLCLQYAFAVAAAHAKRLHTVTEVGDLHSSHSPRPPLTRLDIRTIMTHQPSIERIVADGRIWTVRAVYSQMPCHELNVSNVSVGDAASAVP